jgi:hypothetical protein
MIHSVRRRLRQIRQVGPSAAVRIATSRLGRVGRSFLDGVASSVRPSGLATWDQEAPPIRIATAGLPDNTPDGSFGAPYHFDLLQSGRRNLGCAVPLAELPRAWRGVAARISSVLNLDDSGIDWSVDPTSGFRWSASARSVNIRYGDQPGVEIKWPWELGRMQHLPAIACSIVDPASNHGRCGIEVIERQIADFIRSNPPGFGVQWVCPMDIGIRIANVLLAVDLARAAGADFAPAFLRLVSATARDHARYIVRHLEWGERLCSNHYLANVAGLLYVGAYLGNDPEASDWLAFAGREMVHQIRCQFHEEGSNFEGSTCYHRLSAEIAIHSVALMLWISRHRPKAAERWWSGPVRNFHPAPAAPATASVQWIHGLRHPFDEGIVRRLAGMGRFTASLLRDDGSVPQVGDNDSGRFMRLEMSADPAADIDDHRHLIRAIGVLFGTTPSGTGRESDWLASWLGDATLPMPEQLTEPVGAWHEFGLFVWRNTRFSITLRCGHVGQLGNGGHSHCDQLSITLNCDDGVLLDDSGTGVYTPDPAVRRSLRVSGAHSTVLVPGREQGEWLPGRWGLFAMTDKAAARMISVDSDGGVAEMFEGAYRVRRTVCVQACGVRILDEAPPGSVANFVLGPRVVVERIDPEGATLRLGRTRMRVLAKMIERARGPWSPRYGCVESTEVLRCPAGIVQIELGRV